MTVQEVVLDLLGYANIYGFVLGGANEGEDESEIVRAISAIDQSTQLIYRDGPLSLKYASRSAFINLPTTINLSVTQGQKTATMSGNFAAWMRGCSLMIESDGVLNRILDVAFDNDTAQSTFTFLRAYTGATGGVTATVYADTFLMDSDVSAVLEPVTLSPNNRLRPAQSKPDFLASHYWSCLVSGRGCCYVPFYTTWEKVTGNPQEFRVEQMMDSAAVGGAIYLSVNPMPTVVGNINFDVYRRPVPINRATDLAEDGGDDPEKPIKSLTPDMIESFLLPIARWRYVAAHPNVQNRETRGALKTDYDDAYARLKNGMSLEPQINVVRARYL